MRQPSKFGKYLLLDRIAVGGMAEVFVAKAFGVEGFERLLAIKKILPTMGEDQEFISMFVDEARIAVQLSHANIVQVLELGKHEENLYIAMEYISGRDVRQLLERFRKRGRPMPAPQACLIVAKVCEALDYAHRKRDARGVPLGIVHRDVSPQNVLVSFEGEVKLIDFGIAKAESRLQRTQAGILKGKFSYMSPEQVRGLAVDSRSDIFAAGVLLWELLCGEKLFTGDSDFAVLEKVRNGVVPLPRSVNPELSEALERVMRRALATEVADRYQNASELHDDLTRFTLLGDSVYGSRQLAEWIREDFAPEYEKEQVRLRGWLGVEEDAAEVTPVDLPRPRASAAAGMHLLALPPLPVPKVFAARANQALRGNPPAKEWRQQGEGETLVQPPTPHGRAATPPRGSPSLAPEEQPTMKMDAGELERAELEFARQTAALREAREGGLAEAKDLAPPERTNVDDLDAKPRPPPVFGEAIEVGPVGRSLPARGAQAEAQPKPASLFDNSADSTGAPRAHRRSALARPEREGGPTALGWSVSKLKLLWVPVAVTVIFGVWFAVASPEETRAGKVVFTVSPSVACELFLDGKPAGQVPPFVHAASAGRHRLELRAQGYKVFSAAITVPARGRPLEVEAQLVAEGPMQVEGVVLSRPARDQQTSPPGAEVAARPVEKPAPVDKPERSLRRWLLGKKKTTPAVVEKQGAREPASQEPAPSPPAADAALAPGPAATPAAPAAQVALVEPAPAPEPQGEPRLHIVTDPPGAEVSVDGRLVGRAPVTTDPLDAQHYHPVSAALDGYATLRRATKLQLSGITELRLTLTPQRPPQAAATPGNAQQASATVPALGAEPAVAAPVGYLVAATKPAARVSIDGHETGRWTPVQPANPIALPAGAHTIVFETADGKKLEEQVVIEAGKTARLIRSVP